MNDMYFTYYNYTKIYWFFYDSKFTILNFNNYECFRYLWVDFDEAITDYTAALKLNPDFAVAHYNRGQVHYRLGKYLLYSSKIFLLILFE